MRAFQKRVIALVRNTTFCLSQFGGGTPVCTFGYFSSDDTDHDISLQRCDSVTAALYLIF